MGEINMDLIIHLCVCVCVTFNVATTLVLSMAASLNPNMLPH